MNQQPTTDKLDFEKWDKHLVPVLKEATKQWLENKG